MSGPEELEDLAGLRLLVLGDIILDRYVVGDTPRISPEAPVPVVKVSDEECRVGGAANVAANLAALGAKVKLLGVVGRDSMADVLKERVRECGVSVAGLVTDASRPTVQKTRVVARHQQVLRVDREEDGALSEVVQRRLLARLDKGLSWAQGVILSDYGKGVLTESLIEAAIGSGLPVFVDPKGRDYRRYRGATTLTPNAREAAEATGIDTDDREGCRRAAQRLLKEARLESVIITRGAQGIYYRTRRGDEGNVPARARGVFDVTGAGDTVIAVLALARTAGRTLEQGLLLANAAAGVVVERLGAAVVTREELADALAGRASSAAKVSTLAEAAQVARGLRARGRRVVLTNGCFDLLHPGHVESLEFARSQGEFLMVAVNEDASVRRQKDDLRPVQDLEARLRVLAALECVGLVFSFAEDTPEQVVRALTPHVLVKGEDWKEKGVVGQDWVESHGGQVVLAPLKGGHSTTAIIEHIQRHTNGKGREHAVADLESLLQRFPEVQVGVVGDVIADLYLFARPSRVSREAPVLVVEYEREETIPGGAANTASNLAALGVGTELVGTLGADAAGAGVVRELNRRQVGLAHVESVAGAATITKTRILVGEAHRTKQQMFRVDRNPEMVPAPTQEARLLEALRTLDGRVQGWVVSDYDYGLFTEGMVQWLCEAAARKPVVVDSRHGWKRFRGVTVLTPNEGEAQEATGLPAETPEDAEAMGEAMRDQAGVESLLLTRGNLGMMLFERGRAVTNIPIAGLGEVVDVSGAGDTVVAAFTAALLAGATTVQAAWIANCAASVVVMKLGAATCTPQELSRVLVDVVPPPALMKSMGG